MKSTDIERFKETVESNKLLSVFIDKLVQEDDNTISYTFDGFIPCGIWYRDGVYYDIQDGTIEMHSDDYKSWSSYKTIDEIFDRLIDEFG